MSVPRSNVAFLPWIGDRYLSGIGDKRVLVLGESHYHNCEDEPSCREEVSDAGRNLLHQELTRDVVGWWKDNAHRSPLSHRVPKLFEMDKPDFWESVAFYNYVQTFAGVGPRIRPNEDQWSEAANAPLFQKVIDDLEPDRVLVLGKKLWSNMPSSPSFLARRPEPELKVRVSGNLRGYANDDHTCYWYRSRGDHAALTMPIMHPSAVRFKIKEWVSPVHEWLSFNG